MIDSEGTPLDRIIHAWPIIAFLVASATAAWRFLVVRPLNRLATVEKKLDKMADGVDEIRVAQARSSDHFNHQIDLLVERVDRVLEIMHRDCDH